MVNAKSDKINSSVFKLKIISDIIKGEKIENAINQLEFCKKKGAKKIKNVLKSVISNAQNNYEYDIDKLYIKNIVVNKKKSLKRSVIRARGKIDKINKYFSSITITLDKIKNGTKSKS